MRVFRVFLGLLLLVSGSAAAHPLAPALLSLHETHANQFEVLWRTSATRVQRQDVLPRLPSNCHTQGERAVRAVDGEAVEARWTVDCGSDGIAGRTIAVDGLAGSGINVILRIERGAAIVETLLGGERSQRSGFTVPAAGESSPVFQAYLGLGVSHLLGGPDHLLFLLGLLLLVGSLRKRVVTVTAFTLGHSLTLALAALGVLRFDAALMELGIAASLLVLAVEVARPAGSAPSALARRPWLLALGFGLLHGLGFAGALAETGLPRQSIAMALLAFNIGIEMGQLMAIAAALALAAIWQRRPAQQSGGAAIWSRMARVLPSYVMGSMAAWWCLERALTWSTTG